MNVKKFLKLDKRKNVIAIFLFVFIWFTLSKISFDYSSKCYGDICENKPILGIDFTSFFFIIIPIISIIISYLISCFIVWIYEEVKKK